MSRKTSQYKQSCRIWVHSRLKESVVWPSHLDVLILVLHNINFIEQVLLRVLISANCNIKILICGTIGFQCVL